MHALTLVRRAALILIAALLAACGSTSSTTPTATPDPYNPIYGIDLGIHVLSGSSGDAPVPDSQIVQLLQALQGRTQWIRAYNVQASSAHVPMLAHQLGFKVAASAILTANRSSSEAALAELYRQVNNGWVDLAIVGNEEVHVKAMDSLTLIGYINEARQAVGSKVPIATVEPDKTLLQHPEIMRACDVVLANIPPISYGIPPSRALAYVQTTWQQISSVSGGHEVQIGETEWASDGVRPLVEGKPFIGPQIAATYFVQVETWARQAGVKVFYFEGFDEPWLAMTDTVGPHWGIFTNQLTIKPGFEPGFQK